MRTVILFTTMLSCALLHGQTYFYIESISVLPAQPTVSDNVNLQLAGNLSSTGAYIVSADAQVNGTTVALTIVAADNGGLAVLVPHTESIDLGQLPAGDYSITFTLNTSGTLDLAPQNEHFFSVSGGDPCDHLLIASVQWHAFSDTSIVVHAQNTDMSGELFDYPNFILYDSNGDTLAKETVNFFGIGSDSWHLLRVLDDASVPTTSFDGTLELWTGFTTSLACTYDMTFDLCPPEPCATFMPSMGNYGGALVLGTFNWEVLDEVGVVASGQFVMTETEQYVSDSLCLPPGEYQMMVSPTAPPTGGGPMFFVTDPSGYSSALWPVEWSLPVALPVHFFLPCADGTNVVPEPGASSIDIRLAPNGVQIERADGSPLGPLHVYAEDGRIIHAASVSGSRAVLDLPAAGVYVIRVGDQVIKAAWVLP